MSSRSQAQRDLSRRSGSSPRSLQRTPKAAPEDTSKLSSSKHRQRADSDQSSEDQARSTCSHEGADSSEPWSTSLSRKPTLTGTARWKLASRHLYCQVRRSPAGLIRMVSAILFALHVRGLAPHPNGPPLPLTPRHPFDSSNYRSQERRSSPSSELGGRTPSGGPRRQQR